MLAGTGFARHAFRVGIVLLTLALFNGLQIFRPIGGKWFGRDAALRLSP